jgi:2-polyprenyl-3-methyl-5-hydroxy-6-metoxy-1,4-benzoquinol methylase
MACSGYVEYDADTDRFTLPPEQAFCLANPDSPAYFSGLFEMLPTWYANAAKVADAFKTGAGVPQREYGEEFWHGFERFTRAQFLNHLVQDWIAGVDGLDTRLRAGARVADVGSGNGHAILIMAREYPNSTFVGYDSYELAVESARARAADAGVDGQVRYELRDVAEGIPGRYDLITVFDTVHDMVDPIGALTAIREALTRDGVLLWTEFNVSGDLAENLANPINLAKFTYSASTLYCMTTSLAEGGAGIGTCMGPHKAEELAREAGFGSFRRLPIEDPFTAVYEARP